jgi:hypothetical protein
MRERGGGGTCMYVEGMLTPLWTTRAVSRIWLENEVVIWFAAETTNSSLLRKAQNDTEDHAAYCWMVTSALSRSIKRSKREADHSFPCSTKINHKQIILLLSHTMRSWRVCEKVLMYRKAVVQKMANWENTLCKLETANCKRIKQGNSIKSFY